MEAARLSVGRLGLRGRVSRGALEPGSGYAPLSCSPAEATLRRGKANPPHRYQLTCAAPRPDSYWMRHFLCPCFQTKARSNIVAARSVDGSPVEFGSAAHDVFSVGHVFPLLRGVLPRCFTLFVRKSKE